MALVQQESKQLDLNTLQKRIEALEDADFDNFEALSRGYQVSHDDSTAIRTKLEVLYQLKKELTNES